MRQIKNQEEANKKKKLSYTIIGGILIILLLFSSIGYAFLQGSGNNSASQSESYNGFKFERYGQYWKTIISNNNLYFRYLPQEIENISILGDYDISNYKDKTVYFVSGDVNMGEIIQNIMPYILRYQEACIPDPKGLKNCKELPIKNCTEDLVIIYNPDEEIGIRNEEKCVYISGDSIKASDAFMYSLFKIIN